LSLITIDKIEVEALGSKDIVIPDPRSAYSASSPIQISLPVCIAA
jgi:hypothetical protein